MPQGVVGCLIHHVLVSTGVRAHYSHPGLLSRFSDEGMEVIERLIYLYHKFHQLKVSNEEYACMKAINFLNQGEWLGLGPGLAACLPS